MAFDYERIKELRELERKAAQGSGKLVFGDPILVRYHHIVASYVPPTLDELLVIVGKAETAAVARLEGELECVQAELDEKKRELEQIARAVMPYVKSA